VALEGGSITSTPSTQAAARGAQPASSLGKFDHIDIVNPSGSGAAGTTAVSVSDTVTPSDDFSVWDGPPTTNYGSATILQVDADGKANFVT